MKVLSTGVHLPVISLLRRCVHQARVPIQWYGDGSPIHEFSGQRILGNIDGQGNRRR